MHIATKRTSGQTVSIITLPVVFVLELSLELSPKTLFDSIIIGILQNHYSEDDNELYKADSTSLSNHPFGK